MSDRATAQSPDDFELHLARRLLFMSDLRQPCYPKPHIQRGRDGFWYLVDVRPFTRGGRGTWRQKHPITTDPRS